MGFHCLVPREIKYEITRGEWNREETGAEHSRGEQSREENSRTEVIIWEKRRPGKNKGEERRGEKQ